MGFTVCSSLVHSDISYHDFLHSDLLDCSSEATSITRSPLISGSLDHHFRQSSTNSYEQLKCAKPHLSDLKEEIKELEEKYQLLTNEVLGAFRRENVSLNEVKGSLMQLPVSLKLECNTFLQDQASRLISAPNIDELFWILSAYWDFMNPSLLVHLVKKFGDVKTKALVDIYMEELRGFRMRTKVKDFINQWTGQTLSEFQKIDVVLKDDWKECSLEQLEQFRNELSGKRWLESYVLRFDGVKKSSVAAVFSLPKAFDSRHLDLESLQEFFQEHQVLRVFLNGVCIINLQVYIPC